MIALDGGELAAIWASERGSRRHDIAGFRVAELIAFEVDIDPAAITGASRKVFLDWVRAALVYVLHRRTNAELYQVARLLGRSKNAVARLLAAAESLADDDGEFQRLDRVAATLLEAM